MGLAFILAIETGYINDPFKTVISTIITIIAFFIWYYVLCTIRIKRLHDIDVSGWWLILWVLLTTPLDMIIIGMLKTDENINRFDIASSD